MENKNSASLYRLFLSSLFCFSFTMPSAMVSAQEDNSLSVSRLALLVENAEIEYGPFDNRLNEVLESAADELNTLGDHLAALRLYERAFHVARINDGLYSERQIGIVEKLIDSNVAMENWAAVDQHFRYLNHLYVRLYEEGSQELSRGLAQISDWHVLALNKGIGVDRIDHLREANKLFRQRLALAEEAQDVDAAMLDILRRNLAATQYHLRIASGGSSDLFVAIDDRYGGQLAGLE